MAGRTQEIIRAIFGCKNGVGICGNPILKYPNYRSGVNMPCRTAEGQLVNSNNSGVSKYGGEDSSNCCDTGCGTSAGKIPVATSLSNRPSSPVISSQGISAPKQASPQKTWLGTAPITYGGGTLG